MIGELLGAGALGLGVAGFLGDDKHYFKNQNALNKPIMSKVRGMQAGPMKDFLQGVGNQSLTLGKQINDYLKNTGREHLTGGFKNAGHLMARMPLKHLAKQNVMFGAFEMAAGVWTGEKSLTSVGDWASSMWHALPSTLAFELAAGGASMFSKAGMLGMGKMMATQYVGEKLGLGPWGTLAMQVVSATKLTGLTPVVAAAAVGMKVGEMTFDMYISAYQRGVERHRMNFQTGDLSFATAEAATMRQRSLAAIQNSQLNLRSVLGNEAAFLMGR